VWCRYPWRRSCSAGAIVESFGHGQGQGQGHCRRSAGSPRDAGLEGRGIETEQAREFIERSGALVHVNTGKAIGPIACANVFMLKGDFTVTFALLAVPAGIGLWCVWAAHRGLGRE